MIWSHVLGAWRYRWYGLLLAWVFALAGWGVTTQLPNLYRASGQIHVDRESVLKPLLRGLVIEPDTQRSLELISRTLLSRPNLERIVGATGVDLASRSPEEAAAIIGRVRSNLKLSSTNRSNLYKISYKGQDPRQARDIVRAAVALFVEQSKGEGREEAESAVAFLERKIKDYEGRLEEAENRLMEFKRQHTGEMPGASGDYYDRLQRKMADLEEARFRLKTAVSRQQELERQMEGEQPSFGMMGDGMAEAAAGGTPELDQRIAGMQERLDQLLLKYTERHPEVVALHATLDRLMAERRQKQAELAAAGVGPARGSLDRNPVYQEIRAALARARAEVVGAESQVSQYRQQIESLQKKVDTIPQVEAKLAQLNRDYQSNRETYERLLQRRQSAEMSEEVETSSRESGVRVVEAPQVPAEPVAPNRPLLATASLGAAVASCGALGVFLSLMWPAFYTRSGLYNAARVPVFGGIGYVYTRSRRRRFFVDLVLYLGACGLLVGAYLAVLSLGLGA